MSAAAEGPPSDNSSGEEFSQDEESSFSSLEFDGSLAKRTRIQQVMIY